MNGPDGPEERQAYAEERAREDMEDLDIREQLADEDREYAQAKLCDYVDDRFDHWLAKVTR